ncbi:MAG: LPP20 family lipoprotein [Myxococcota bacterium]
MKLRLAKVLTVGLSVSAASAAWAAPPGWASGKDPKYPAAKLLLGVGKGPKSESADLDARAEISRIFESKVSSVMTDFQASASKINGSGKGVNVEVQTVAQLTKVTTQKTLKGVEIKERGQDGSTFYALAVLDREQCVNSLTEELEGYDQKISAAVSAAEGADPMTAFKKYGAAMNMMDERESLNAMLRVCDPKGKGVPSPVSMSDLSAKFDEASGSIHIGLIVEGNGADKVKDCVMEALGNKGYQIEDIKIDEEEDEEEDDAGNTSKFDVVLRGKLKSEKAGEIAGSVMVKTDLTLKVINAKTNKVLKTMTASRKEGRRDVKASAALSAHKLCLNEAPKIAEAIDKAFKK